LIRPEISFVQQLSTGAKMAFLEEHEQSTLSIKRMIFHVVGKSLDEPILLEEISPPQHTDFFLERVKSSLRGNLFEFRDLSSTERAIRSIVADPANFAQITRELAADFQSRHSNSTSVGVFFVFELSIGADQSIFALIKYDNEDVVRYMLNNNEGLQVPKLERFQESFVRKAEAMQKIALVRLNGQKGGLIAVRDRSNAAHISDYFEGFLQARRVNSPDDLSEKLVSALKDTFKEHKDLLPEEVAKSGVNRIYEVLRQGGHTFDPDDCEPLLTAVFGKMPENSKLRRTFSRKLKSYGVSEETFEINPEKIQTPRRRLIETQEGVEIRYDDGKRPQIKEREDGRREIVIVTAGIRRDDVAIDNGSRSR
jgi:hypothetical protein